MLEIPEEIVCRIFTLACVTDHIKVNELSDPIWIFRQVCSHWRKVVDGTPLFWKSWEVNYPADASPSCIATRVELCLKNAKDLPLSIAVKDASFRYNRPYTSGIRMLERLPDGTYALPKEPYHDIVPIVSPHLSHCENLTVPIEFIENAFEGTIKPDLSSIRKLFLCWGTIRSAMFQGATSLQELTLFRVGIKDTEFPFSQVKKLSFRSCALAYHENRIYDILKSAPLLEELEWANSEHSYRPDGNLAGWEPIVEVETPVTLQFLHTLRLHDSQDCYGHKETPWILPMINAPSLKTLELKMEARAAAPPNLVDFVERSTCKIKRLQLICTDLWKILGPLSDDMVCGIEEVGLINCQITDRFFFDGRLSVFSGIIPALRKLELYQKSNVWDKQDLFEKMKLNGDKAGVEISMDVSDRWDVSPYRPSTDSHLRREDNFANIRDFEEGPWSTWLR